MWTRTGTGKCIGTGTGTGKGKCIGTGIGKGKEIMCVHILAYLHVQI